MVERVVVAPDKFKGSLSATDVTARVTAGLARGGFSGEVVPVPVADGGDGTVAAAVAAGYRRVDVEVRGPVGAAVTASFALLDGTAVIEAAQACGLTLLPPGELAPLTATSRGVGELILAASRMGATRIVLGVGGVATTDGGAGLLQALGARAGRRVRAAAAARRRRACAGWPRSSCPGWTTCPGWSSGSPPTWTTRCSASPARPRCTDRRRARPPTTCGCSRPGWRGGRTWPRRRSRRPGGAGAGRPSRHRVADEPGAGAAGGLGFAALLFLGARMRPGIELLLELASFGERLDGARLVITGEGSLDAQTLHGKAPVGVARAAAGAHAAGSGGGGRGPVHAVTG